VLALATAGFGGPRLTRWFFRVRNLEYFHGIESAGGIPEPRPVRVFCYHAVANLGGAGALEPYGIPPEEFCQQLRFLARRFRFLDAAEFVRFLDGAGVPRSAALLTFDDCYEDLLGAALPVLSELGIPALAFAVTQRVGRTNDWDAAIGAPQLLLLDADGLLELAEAGIAIGSHSRTHRMLNRVDPVELADELRGSMADLEELGLGRPSFLAYPHGEHDAEVRRAAAEAGFLGAFTVTAGDAQPDGDRYAIPRLEILRADSGRRFRQKATASPRR
jgi:peptidoglycan/xylan/chitin deacetylase (PgdA/CDA1 family)